MWIVLLMYLVGVEILVVEDGDVYYVFGLWNGVCDRVME